MVTVRYRMEFAILEDAKQVKSPYSPTVRGTPNGNIRIYGQEACTRFIVVLGILSDIYHRRVSKIALCIWRWLETTVNSRMSAPPFGLLVGSPTNLAASSSIFSFPAAGDANIGQCRGLQIMSIAPSFLAQISRRPICLHGANELQSHDGSDHRTPFGPSNCFPASCNNGPRGVIT
ncbi:hypothetical protein BO70DRAFT_394632 [Aspergillus heteromorphus CBS 117.55]|uniref:Uncharacterized protein n=1 Tax=Aspergillus heteromorphus CBS 117.55 TaxID=1448321 RepID=A0A317WS75_9EURO|nr:uncharacterized protein BO70DRAFT_394632 [Aspergillus heteromorphus CBS 117.55]PWY87768.1 hypothetical protein BO70DRAFT_394632 [Aspergillus heteromorphus CBS 117.55]